jgi:predicted O-methyltransferase YrrM
MTTYNDRLSSYINTTFAGEDEILLRIRKASEEHGLPSINVSPEEGRFLQILVRAANAVNALEFGTLGGYSGTWITRGLAPGGRLITLEREPAHANLAREHFRMAGLEEQVEVLVGHADEFLDTLAAEGPFDFVFIDSGKDEYVRYFDWALRNTRLGATIAAHNAFRGGAVLEDSAEGRVIQEFNNHVINEPSVISTIFPAGDGMVVAVKVSNV